MSILNEPVEQTQMIDRTVENAVLNNLIGSMCHTVGTITKIRNKNPFTHSKRQTHKWMVLLINVTVGGISVDHIWLHGCKRINHFTLLKI